MSWGNFMHFQPLDFMEYDGTINTTEEMNEKRETKGDMTQHSRQLTH